MTEDTLFPFVNHRAGEIERIVRDIEPRIEMLTALPSFKLKPEGTIRRSAERLRQIADELDALADKAPQPRERLDA